MARQVQPMLMFRHLPTARWAKLDGAWLCNARAMGEFGALSVGGRNRGLTNTLPPHIEALYNDRDFVVPLPRWLLVCVTLVFKTALEWRYCDELSHARQR